MVTVGRVLLWTVALVAPGGFLLVPVLAASSLHSADGTAPTTLRGRLALVVERARGAVQRVQRYWTKS